MMLSTTSMKTTWHLSELYCLLILLQLVYHLKAREIQLFTYEASTNVSTAEMNGGLSHGGDDDYIKSWWCPKTKCSMKRQAFPE